MQKRITTFIPMILLGLSIAISGCAPNSTIPDTPLKSEEMRADISGFGSFFASNARVSETTMYDVRASVLDASNSDSLVISLSVTKSGLVPYTINVASDDNSAISFCRIKPDGSCTNYVSDKVNGGSGQIKITSISPNLQGTFSGTLPQVGGSGSISIFGGEFNASF